MNEWRRRFPGLISFFSGAAKPAGRFLFYCSTGDILLEGFHFRRNVELLETRTDMTALCAGIYRFGKSGLLGPRDGGAPNPSGILMRTDAVRAEDGSVPLSIANFETKLLAGKILDISDIQLLSYAENASGPAPKPGSIPGTVLDVWTEIHPVAAPKPGSIPGATRA